MFSPFYSSVFYLLAALYFCSGCENKPLFRIGDKSPSISGTNTHGERFSLDQLRGKVYIIFFWTNSCCGDKVKLLEPLYRQNRSKGLDVLAVNVGDTKEIVESYAKTNDLTFTLLTDEYSKISKQYGVFGFPTIFIIDKNGIIREKIHGDIPTDKLNKLLTKQFKIQTEIEANYEKIHPR
jgi:peroxiredoxin